MGWDNEMEILQMVEGYGSEEFSCYSSIERTSRITDEYG